MPQGPEDLGQKAHGKLRVGEEPVTPRGTHKCLPNARTNLGFEGFKLTEERAEPFESSTAQPNAKLFNLYQEEPECRLGLSHGVS